MIFQFREKVIRDCWKVESLKLRQSCLYYQLCQNWARRGAHSILQLAKILPLDRQAISHWLMITLAKQNLRKGQKWRNILILLQKKWVSWLKCRDFLELNRLSQTDEVFDACDGSSRAIADIRTRQGGLLPHVSSLAIIYIMQSTGHLRHSLDFLSRKEGYLFFGEFFRRIKILRPPYKFSIDFKTPFTQKICRKKRIFKKKL